MKQFEEEYKEYINAQAPDLWDRIEDGVDQKISKQTRAQNGKKKKKNISLRYKRMRFGASIAACIATLIIAIPVIRHVGTNRNDAPAAEAPELADVTIENTQELAQVTEEEWEESAVMEDSETETNVVENAKETEEETAVEEIAYEQQPADLIQAQNAAKEKGQKTEEAGGVDAGELATGMSSLTGETELADSVAEETGLQSESGTVVAKVVSLHADSSSDTTVYEIEVIRVDSGSMSVSQILTITAGKSMQLLEQNCEYTMSLTNINLQNMTAVLHEIVQ